jgi:hypothetical protein
MFATIFRIYNFANKGSLVDVDLPAVVIEIYNNLASAVGSSWSPTLLFVARTSKETKY